MSMEPYMCRIRKYDKARVLAQNKRLLSVKIWSNAQKERLPLADLRPRAQKTFAIGFELLVQ